MKQIISTTNAPQPGGPYSQAVVAGDLIFVAGQVPRDPHTGHIPGSFEEQVRQVFKNMTAILEAAGSNLNQVVRVDVYLNNLGDFANLNNIYKTYFTDNYPVRTTVGVTLNGFDVEISCIAHKLA